MSNAIGSLVLLAALVFAAELLRLLRRPAPWKVRASELHSQGLLALCEDGWEPFAFVAHETSAPRDDASASRLDGYVLLRRRLRGTGRPMPPDDEARWHGSPG